MSKRLPRIKTDREAKSLVKKDLSTYLSPANFPLASFEFAPKRSPKLISTRKNDRLLKKLGPKGGVASASSLKAYRLRQELTQQELAKKSGVSQANISAMEKGTRPIGLNVAKKLADVLRCDYRRLL